MLPHELSDLHHLLSPLRTGGVDVPSVGYASRIHFLKCSARRFVCPPNLWGWSRCTAASFHLSEGISSLTLKFWCGYATVSWGGWKFPPVQHGIIPCDLGHVHPRGFWCPRGRVAVPTFEDRVRPSKIRVSRCRFQACANIFRGLLYLLPVVH